MKSRLLYVAALAATLAPSGASAAQTGTPTYLCKFPLFGTTVIDPVVTSQIPERIEPGVPTGPFGIAVTIPGVELAPTVASVDDAGTLEGTITLSGVVRSGEVARPFPDVTLALPATSVRPAASSALADFVATGTGPSITFPDAGVAHVDVTGFAISLKVRQTDGTVVDLPKVSKDLDGLPVVDSDGDPSTYDAPCKLDGVRVARIADVVVGAAPTVMPTPSPLPSQTPKPTPPPAPAPMRQVLPGSTGASYGCKWPLAGVSEVRVWSHFTDVAAAGDAVEYELWFTHEGPNVYGTEITDLAAFEGRLDATLGAITPGGVIPIDVPAPIDTYLFSTSAATGVPMLHSVGTVAKSALPAGTTGLMLLTLRPSIRLVDSRGATIAIPPLTTAYDGVPVPDDGNPYTFGVPCRPEVAQPTRLAYVLQGSTSLNTLARGAMPITGRVAMSVAPSTGVVAAELKLNDTQGRLIALGFLPVTVSVGFVTSGASTGLLTDDRLALTSKVRIKVKSAKLFGVVPIVAGNTCQTRSFTDLSLLSTESFDPIGTGGTLGGTYAISDLNGCGPLNGLVSPITAGAGNTISVKLTPTA